MFEYSFDRGSRRIFIDRREAPGIIFRHSYGVPLGQEVSTRSVKCECPDREGDGIFISLATPEESKWYGANRRKKKKILVDVRFWSTYREPISRKASFYIIVIK